jgi:hypothetical protein
VNLGLHKPLLLATALAFLCLILPPAASAIDPGRVQGTLQVNGRAITLTQAYAHLHDNAEGLLDHPRELRLLLADREVPQESLSGLAPLTALARLARDGRLQGLLLKLNPRDPRHLELTLLSPPPASGETLLTRTITVSSKSSSLDFPLSPPGERVRVSGEKPAFNLSLHPQRLAGAFTCPPEPRPGVLGLPNLACSLRFSAPLFHEPPVTAVLVGRAAQTSPRVQVLRAKARALGQGDFAALQSLSTAPALQETQTLPAPAGPDAAAWAKHEAAKLQASLKHLQRLVVRGNRAVVVFGDKHWQDFVREGGEWKIDH